MFQVILILFTGLMASFFLFPFNPYNAPANTKMVLAVLGVVVFLMEKIKTKEVTIPLGLLIVMIISAVISIWSFFVTSFCGTEDYSYAYYFVSVLVWISAAYFVVWMIKQVHKTVNIRLVSMYLIGVCVFQSLLAYLMTLSPVLKHFIDSILVDYAGAMGIVDGRLYGLGAALDPAGLRFSAVLILCADLLVRTDFDDAPWTGGLFFLAFIIISVFGNMISRTTSVGMVVGVLYLLVSFFSGQNNQHGAGFMKVVIPCILFSTMLCIWLYNVNPDFQKNLRFGFEGFFSLVEKGRWEVHSNDILKSLVVWPESLKTWIIGDGYFMSPLDHPDRFGQVYAGYYMHTDIGYLRYIFYFGVLGLLGMILLFSQMTSICVKAFDEYKWVFIVLFVINCIGWLKVSSDLIMVFTPFAVLAFLSEKKVV